MTPIVIHSCLCLAGLGCGSLSWRLKGFESILIDLQVKIVCLDIKLFNGAGHLADCIISDFICPISPGIGWVAWMVSKKMDLVLEIKHSLYSCSMVIEGNP